MIKRFLESDFAAAYIVLAVANLVIAGLNFFIPIHLRNTGFSGFQIGLLMAIPGIAVILFVFQIGIFTDRFLIKHVALSGMVFLALRYIGLGTSESFLLLSASFLLGGIGKQILDESMTSYTFKKIIDKPGERIGLLEAVKTVPAAIGILLSGYIISIMDFSTAFKIAAFVLMLVAFVLFLMPGNQQHRFELKDYISDMKNRSFVIFCVLIFVFTLHWGVEATNYGLFLENNLGLSLRQMGWYMSIPVIFLAASAFFFGKRFDRGLRARSLLLTAFFLSSIGFFGMAATADVYVSFVFRIIHEIGDGAFIIFYLTGIKRFFQVQRIGGNLGFVILVSTVGAFVGSLIFSTLGEKIGYNWPHIIMGVVIFLTGFLIFLYNRKPVVKNL